MRKHCPVCGSSKREIFPWNFRLPSDWNLPKENLVCGCPVCGFIYYDNKATQKTYNRYYADRYGFGCFGAVEHQKRLDSFANCVKETLGTTLSVSDYGGGDGYLASALKKRGFEDADTWDVGDLPKKGRDIITASHVLEHVYDLEGCVRMIKGALFGDGYVVAEVPDEMAASFAREPSILDYNFVHINHFSPYTLDLLFSRFGFSKIYNEPLMYDVSTISQVCYRAIYQLDNHMGMWERTKAVLQSNRFVLSQRLMKIDKPVIVWGCGATILNALDIVAVPIAYFVDRDEKAYREGSTINGIPVYNSVHSDEPILICAFGQKDDILKDIQKSGLKNEVIIV